MESKYLNFIKQDVPTKTALYKVENKSGEYLGIIRFWPAWRKYIFIPKSGDLIFDSSCLSDIITELNNLTAEWRASLKKEK